MGNRKVKPLTIHQAEEKWPAVTYFKEKMLRKLIKHESKGGWDLDSLDSLVNRLKEETAEIEETIKAYEKLPASLREDPNIKAAFQENIRAEAADVGNFAMMIFDNSKNL